jgi:dTDP-4-dehydrorhamnose reductase/S-adenosylmethionine synthetase
VSRRFGGPSGVVGWSHGDHDGYASVDVTSQESIERALYAAETLPDTIIHCAANPNIAACEADPAKARELNAEAVRKVAVAAKARGIYLVYISTDYVFAGDKEGGYIEQDPPSPLQVYGATKAVGERYCLEVADGLVVRVPLLYGVGYALRKTTFPEQVVTSLRAGEEVKADAVEVRQPLFTVDAADALYQLVEARVRGIVHVAAQQGITKYDWATEIAKLLGLDAGLIQQTTPAPGAKRPVRSWLHDRRLREFGFPPLRPALDATQAFLAESGLHRALRVRGVTRPQLLPQDDHAIPATRPGADSPRKPDAVHVGTLHRFKGLEYQQMLVAGVSTGLIPDARIADHRETDPRPPRA